MKRLAVVLGLLAAAGLALAEPPPTTIACTSTDQSCDGVATSTCAGLVPDAGSATGIPTANVRSYFVRVCPPVEQTLAGAGSALDYHCRAANGRCAEVRDNRQAINAPNGPAGTCWESGTFTVPYLDNTSDTMTWVLSGVTVTPGDAGTATVTICPQH